MFHLKLHHILFHIFLFLIAIQTRILYSPDKAYVSWYFDYHLAFFLYLTDILIFACFAAWILFDPPEFQQLATNKLFLLTILFFCLVIVTLFHVKRLDLGAYQTLKWLEFLGILLYIRFVFRSKRIFETSLAVLFISGVFQAILGWYQFHMQHMVGLAFLGEYIAPLGTSGLATIETGAGKIIRAYGTMPHPNILGAFLVLSLVAGLYFVSSAFAKATADKHETKLRILTIFGLYVILIGIFTTFSRTAWIAAALSVIGFVGYYLWSNRKKTALLIVALILVSCGTIFALYKNNFEERVANTSNVSIDDRYFFNSLGWGIAERFPILGVGAGNYVIALHDLYELAPWQHQPPHNIFIFVAAELGILGAGLFIIILFEIFSRLKTIKYNQLAYSLILVGILFLLMGQFDHYFATIQQGRLMFAVVLGLLAALPNLSQEKIPE